MLINIPRPNPLIYINKNILAFAKICYKFARGERKGSDYSPGVRCLFRFVTLKRTNPNFI